MSPINTLFGALVSMAVVSMIVLAVGSLMVRFLRQPIERVRAIQWTLAALLVAVTIRQAALLPTWSVAVLPPAEEVFAGEDLAGDEDVVQWQPGEAVAGLTAHATARPSFHAPQPPLRRDFSNAPMTASVAKETKAAATSRSDVQTSAISSGVSPWTPWEWFQFTCLAVATSGTIWFAALLVIGRLRLARVLRHCTQADESLLARWPAWPSARARGTRVLVSSATDAPLTCGVRRPVIILPQRLADGASEQALHYCLAHEWAHIQNRDIASWWGLHAMLPLLWFQPLFWFVRRELRLAVDQLADDFAAGRSVGRADYAQLLVNLATRRAIADSGFALSMADRKSTLFRRVEMLLTAPIHLTHVARRRVLIGLFAGLFILTISLCVLRIDRAVADDPPSNSADSAAPADAADAAVAAEEDEGDATDLTQGGASANEQATERASADEDAEELSYSGMVVNKKTKLPIAGATVVVRRMILLSYERRILEETTHKTDTFGMYHFKIPPEQTAESALYIELDVEHPDYAWKKGFGYALSMIRKNERLGEKPFFSHVELWPSEPITGRVVDSDGKPLEGVDIQAYSKADAQDYQDYGSFFRTETDAEGKFQLNMVKGGPSIFWVVPENHTPVQIVSGTKRGDWGDITVSDGISISGQVQTATGEPVAGVWVNLEDIESQREIQMPVASSMRRSSQTDQAGHFSLGPMKPGKYRLNVDTFPRELKFHKAGRQPIELEDVFISQEIEIGPEDTGRPFIIRAVPHVEFHGQYLDSSGNPRRGHRVMVYGRLDDTWYHTSLRPDENGKIVGKLPHGLTGATMDAITNEHGAVQVRLKQDGELLGGRDLKLGTIEEDITGVEFIRYQAPIVLLKPVNEEGNLVRGVQVSGVYSDGKAELMHPVNGKPTNIFFEEQKDGRFRTSQMIPDREVTFTASAEGYEDATVTISLPEGEEKEVAVVLKQKQEEAE